jgi:L-fucose isomerase-like protein
MDDFRIGYVPLAKGSWLDPRLDEARKQGAGVLRGLWPDGKCPILGGDRLITTEAEALAAVDFFRREQVDAIVCQFITFSLGSLVPLLAERLNLPVVLWSMPEPPMDGGRIAANSFCAVNMNAHALWKLRARYLHVHAAPETAAAKLRAALAPMAAAKRLRRTRLGIIGHRAPGFYTSDANELLLRRRVGVEIEYVTLWELVELAKGMPAAKVDDAVELLQSDSGGVCRLDPEELRKAAALYLAFLTAKEQYNVDVFTVKCWPEFAQLHGIGVCAVLGMLNNRGIIAGCEGDVYGTVTMIAEQEIAGGLPFFCDLISVDGDGNTGVTWHCGAAPKGLCSPMATPMLRKHSIIDGGDKKGVTNEFPLRPGRVTMARLSENRAGDDYRMLITAGDALETPQLLRGNPLRVKFDAPLKDLAKRLVYEGFEHHFALVHGNIVEELGDLCRLLDIETVTVT